MQRYSKQHLLLAGFILAVWAWVPLEGAVRALFVPARCHCPGHARRELPNGPAYAPCDEGSAVQAAGPASPAVAPRTESDTIDTLRYKRPIESRIRSSQITQSVASPPPRHAI